MSGDEEPVSSAARELYHYTSWAGLKGILSSQYLRATRYDKLNDRTELHHFQEALVDAIRKFIYSHVRERSQTDYEFRRAVNRTGGPGKVALNDARHLVDRFYKVTFEGDGGTPPFAVPFLISFCSHSADDQYTRRNGLLSQWRAYGAEASRFALVFDSRKLENLLRYEVQQWSYSFLNICDVIYNDDKLNFGEKFDHLLSDIVRDWDKNVLGEGPGAPDQIFNEFIKSAARFKHRAFHEEREFRVIACPMSVELNKFFVEMGAPPKRELPFKDVERDERGRPYVSLFRNGPKMLPIKRLIVGPHPEQAQLLRQAQEITQNRFPIRCSETPFLG